VAHRTTLIRAGRRDDACDKRAVPFTVRWGEYLAAVESVLVPERGGPSADRSVDQVLTVFVFAVVAGRGFVEKLSRHGVGGEIERRVATVERFEALDEFGVDPVAVDTSGRWD